MNYKITQGYYDEYMEILEPTQIRTDDIVEVDNTTGKMRKVNDAGKPGPNNPPPNPPDPDEGE